MRSIIKFLIVPAVFLAVMYGIYYASWTRYYYDQYALADYPADIPVVGVEEIRPGPVSQWVIGEGTARAVIREILVFEVSGRVKTLGRTGSREIREGDKVAGGQVLGELHDREFRQDVRESEAARKRAEKEKKAARINLKQARIESRLHRANFLRAEKLLAKESISLVDYDRHKALCDQAAASVLAAENRVEDMKNHIAGARARLEKAKINLDRTRITAPFDGIVARINIRKGDYMGPDQGGDAPPFIVIDPSVYEITADLPLVDGKTVTLKDEADIISGIDPSEKYGKGQVYSVSPMLTRDSRAVRVKLRTRPASGPTRPSRLRDGELVRVRIRTGHRPDALTLSRNTLLYKKDRPYVFLLDRRFNTVTQRNVTLGFQEKNRVEILDGLAPGDRVVTDGRHLLMEGLQVNPLEENS